MAESLNEAMAKAQIALSELGNAILRAVGLPAKNMVEYPKFREINNSPLSSSWTSKSMSFWMFVPKSDFIKSDFSIQDAKNDLGESAKGEIEKLGLKVSFLEWLIIDSNGNFLENEFVFLTEDNYNDNLRNIIQQCKKYDLLYFRVKANANTIDIFEGYKPLCQR